MANYFNIAEWRQGNRKNIYNFATLPPSEHLEYERLNEYNYTELFKMFSKDTNPFVGKDYKDMKMLNNYFEYLTKCQYSPTKGACDWLVRHKATRKYIGILNLYNLSKPSSNKQYQKCTIGFSTISAFRGQGMTSEAVKHFIDYIFNNYDITTIQAYTFPSNIASKKLLKKVGFIVDNITNNEYEYYSIHK